MGTVHRLTPKSSRCPECGWKMPSTVYVLKEVSGKFPTIIFYIACPECESQIMWTVEFAVPQQST